MANKCPLCGGELFITDGRRRCINFPIMCTYQEELTDIDAISSNYIVFDFETSGLNRTTDRIIQAAAIRVENGRVTDTFDKFIKPNTGKPIKANITELTGISNDMLLNEPTEEIRIPEFVEWLRMKPYEFAVAHNGNFDVQMLKAACRRLGIPMPISVLVDTLKVSRKVFPKGNKEGVENNKQETLARHYGISYDAHNALNDVTALKDVYENLVKDMKKKHLGDTMDFREFV